MRCASPASMTASTDTGACCGSSSSRQSPAWRRFERKHVENFLVDPLARARRRGGVHARLESDARRAMADQHAVADLRGLADLVGDEDGGLAVLAHQPDELRPQITRGHLVERGERLVAQEELRI